MSDPVFVLGVHRSGTTWLANTLCNHSLIYGVTSPDYKGIVESWYFSHLHCRFGNLRRPENLGDFLETFGRTPFFRCSGVGRDQLKSLHPTNYEDFFARFMALAASRHKPEARWWLEKTPLHTLYIRQLLHWYPQSRFVAVERDLHAVVRSAAQLHFNQHRHSYLTVLVLKGILHWRKYTTYMRHFTRTCPQRILCVLYDDLVKTPEASFRRCLDFLGLDWEVGLLDQRFERNSSFKNPQNGTPINQEKIQRWITLASAMAAPIPYGVFALQELLTGNRTRKPIPFLQEDASVR